MAQPPYICALDVGAAMEWRALADALAEGHKRPRARITDQFLTRGPDTLLSRAAWIDGLGAAVKSVTVLQGNPERNLPSVQGAMILFDDETGTVRAVIDSALVTRWKTAGDSILGARLLARPQSRRLLILGAGAVADSLIEAYTALFPGISVTLWNRNVTRARALAAAHAGVRVTEDLEASARAADIIACATMARTPVLRGDWLCAGQHIDLIGAFTAEMREADDVALARARIFVDSFETTLEHIGELCDPLARGVITRADVLGDLYDLVAGRVGRESSDDITLYKNGGGAHLDLMTGTFILEAWQRLPR